MAGNKFGRNKKLCEIYRSQNRKEKNKKIRIERQRKKEAKKKAQLEKRAARLNPVKPTEVKDEPIQTEEG